jgi:hypothetical protein
MNKKGQTTKALLWVVIILLIILIGLFVYYVSIKGMK